jgi:hypothetical protein
MTSPAGRGGTPYLAEDDRALDQLVDEVGHVGVEIDVFGAVLFDLFGVLYLLLTKLSGFFVGEVLAQVDDAH